MPFFLTSTYAMIVITKPYTANYNLVHTLTLKYGHVKKKERKFSRLASIRLALHGCTLLQLSTLAAAAHNGVGRGLRPTRDAVAGWLHAPAARGPLTRRGGGQGCSL
jgi:hypothetical protein